MDFFQRIAALKLTGDLKLVITDAPNGLLVTLLLVNDKCGDEARKQIIPLNLRGTPLELDEGFFDTIQAQLPSASGLMINLEAFQKSLEKTQQQSAKEKLEETSRKKAKDELKKTYDAAMKRVEELEKEKKYREAYAKTPDPEQHPDQAETIRKKRAELLANFSQPGLFDSLPVQSPSQLANTEDTSGVDTSTNATLESVTA